MSSAYPTALESRSAAARIDERIHAERRALPPHDLDGVNVRRWALAVCGAEVKHRGADFRRCESALRVGFDRWDYPYAEQMGQFAHEARAGEVLSIQNHLVTDDGYVHSLVRTLRSQRAAGWDAMAAGTAGDLRAALQRRRTIWRQFLAAVAHYKAARREFDAAMMRRAA